jgi:amino acid transporter
VNSRQNNPPPAPAEAAAGSPAQQELIRGLGLKEATAANVVEMVGIGPFITIPLLVGSMGGPQALLGWLVGAFLALCDGLIWAELGAAMPGAGGSYVYLREAYGPATLGRAMSFLFVWMILLTAPLTAASGAIGFAQYFHYLVPRMGPRATNMLAVAVIVVATTLAYRNVKAVGRFSFVLMVIVLGTILWVIVSGLSRLQPALLLTLPEGSVAASRAFFVGLGSASLIATYDYGGYNNVCYLGGEVREPGRIIPRAIIISILVVSTMYFFMTTAILGVVPWQKVVQSTHIVPDFMEIIYGRWAGEVLTVLILGAAFASVFALLVGFSRIPYAAAVDGQFFRVFGRLHPTGRFPSVSLLTLGVVSVVFCFLKLEDIIDILIVIQIVILSLPLVLAVTLVRRRRPDIQRPFRMWGYPLPGLLAAAGWVYILSTQAWWVIVGGLVVLGAGIGLYLLHARYHRQWPYTRG